MPALMPSKTLSRSAGWSESFIALSTGQPLDYTGVAVSAILTRLDGGEGGLTASLAAGTIDCASLTGPTVTFVIRVPQEDFAAQCPWGDYTLTIRIERDGFPAEPLTGRRYVRDIADD